MRLLPSPPPVAPPVPGTGVTRWATVAATSGGGTSSGWLYSLLTKAGLDPSTAQSVVDFVVRPLEILLVVVVAALVAHYGARALRRVLGRAAGRVGDDRGVEGRAAARATTVVALVGNLWRLFVAVVAVAVILGMLGLDLTPLLASATVIAATLGFGAQVFVRDYLAGILLTMEDQFGIGDTVTVGEITGVVEDVSLRVTRLRAADGSVWYVPNGDIRRLANASRGWAKAVVDVPVTPRGPGGDGSGGGTLDGVREAVAEAARAVAAQPAFTGAVTGAPEVLGMVDAGAATCTVRVALRTTPGRRAALERALREAVVARLAADGLWPAGGSSASPAAPH